MTRTNTRTISQCSDDENETTRQSPLMNASSRLVGIYVDDDDDDEDDDGGGGGTAVDHSVILTSYIYVSPANCRRRAESDAAAYDTERDPPSPPSLPIFFS
uniref:Uncharacterized protein n=1 Tax=Odontella aurita TaxID=265563 RepID=A0A7S4JIW0_9STRA